MKKILFLMALFFNNTMACAEDIKITVSGMVCSFCAQGIKKNLSTIYGVEKVEPDLNSKIVYVKLNKNGQLSDQQIQKIINDAGYGIVSITRGDK